MESKRRKIIFRTDANSSIGMGHLIRSYSLARMLDAFFDIKFVFSNTDKNISKKFLENRFEELSIPVLSNEEEALYLKDYLIKANASALVLDGYQFDSIYQQLIYSTEYKVIYIDDLVSGNYYCDLLINQAESVEQSMYQTKTQTKFLLGSKYVLLRPEFINTSSAVECEIDSIKNIFVSFGGADSSNMALKVLKSLMKVKGEFKIHILSGPVNQNIQAWASQFNLNEKVTFYSDLSGLEVCQLIKKCDLAIIPNSSLSIEACSVGILMITGTTADNQLGYYNSFVKNNLSIGIGNWEQATEVDIIEKFNSIVGLSQEGKNNQLLNQKKYIDGLSGKRILNEVESLIYGI